MIPYRIKLSGFLSFKEEQEIIFGNAPVWMLAGQNGSGKSSVFDAVTYALFGHHRGGSQNASELINKESNGFTIDFDFRLDSEFYRAKRTLKRSKTGSTSGTQQLFINENRDSPDAPSWKAVPDTNKKIDFDAWILNHLGLNYETFTSSVLLLQGKAEKLLDSKPSGRAELLAGIVNLERYQKLYEKANQRKLTLKGQQESLTHQATAVPEISDLDYLAVIGQIEDAKLARDQTQAQIDALQEREMRARRWSDTNARLATAQRRLAEAETLLTEAVQIEKSHARLVELNQVLPTVQAVVNNRTKIGDSKKRIERYQKEQSQLQDHRLTVDSAKQQAERKRDSLRTTLKNDEARLTDVSKQLRDLSVTLQSFLHAEQQDQDRLRLEQELARFPKNVGDQVTSAMELVDRLNETSRIVPVLERFRQERSDLITTREKLKTEQLQADRTKTEGETSRKSHDAEKKKLSEIQHELDRLKQSTTTASVQLQQARAALDEFASLGTAKTCKACGQALTPAHFQKERTRRQEELERSEQRYLDSQKQLEETRRTEEAQSQKVADLDQELTRLRDHYKDHQNAIKRAKEDIDRHDRFLSAAYAELPEAFRFKIASVQPNDWAVSTFPSENDLSQLRTEVAGLDGARKTLREIQATHERWKQVNTQLEASANTLKKLKAALPKGNLSTIRTEHQSLEAEEQSLQSTIKAAKTNLQSTESEVNRLSNEANNASRMSIELAGNIQIENNIITHCNETIELELRKLDASWVKRLEAAGLHDYEVIKDERNTLIEKDTEGRYRQLQHARAGLESLRAEIASLDSEANAFPESDRCSPEEVHRVLLETRCICEKHDLQWQDARQQKALFDSYRDQRAKLSQQAKEVEAEFHRYKLLAELLGRDRLQRHLVRQAERQIVHYANAVLDRLSSGQLFLKLVSSDDGSTTEKALDLECSNRVTGSSGINVAFLSGSQKFRVAVSLALGIGQYASRQQRPLECVIIDEGFGCLDRQNRQVMIQELQNLRGQLQCILLVSHQEEFADAFSNGYQFRLENGTTQITRFQR